MPQLSLSLLLALAACGSTEEPSPGVSSALETETAAVTLEEIVEPGPTQAVEESPPAVAAHRPTRSWVGEGCRAGQTHPFTDERGQPARLRNRGALAFDAGENGGLLAYTQSARSLALVATNAGGEPTGTRTTLDLPQLGSDVAIQSLGEEFLLTAEARCTPSRFSCVHGYRVNAAGETVGEPIETQVSHTERRRMRQVSSDNAAERTLWTLGQAYTGGRDSWLTIRSLSLEGEVLSFHGAEAGALRQGETGYVNQHLDYADDDNLHVLYGYSYDPTDGNGNERRGRALLLDGAGAVNVTGFGGAVRDFVVVEGVAQVLVEEPRGEFFVTTISESGAASDERLTVPADGPIPAPFSERVLLATPDRDGDRGNFQVRDSLGRAIGEPVELPRGAQAIAFTGQGFLVVHVDARRALSITAIECGAPSTG